MGQHDQLLREVVEALKTLSNNVMAIGQQVNQVTSQLLTSGPATPASLLH